MEDFRPTDLSYHKVVDDRPTYHAKFTTMTFGYSLPKVFFKVYEKYERVTERSFFIIIKTGSIRLTCSLKRTLKIGNMWGTLTSHPNLEGHVTIGTLVCRIGVYLNTTSSVTFRQHTVNDALLQYIYKITLKWVAEEKCFCCLLFLKHPVTWEKGLQ